MSESHVKPGLIYTKEHEWLVVDGNVAVVGITDYAQAALGDLVYVDLPAIGKLAETGKDIAVVESCKAASDVYSPVAGKIVAVNDELKNAPELINQSPYDQGWIFKIELSNPDEIKSLLSEQQYRDLLAAA
ncbi:MAG: glycine cleavage system protein GcvH [Alphaproteobacteria bacterium]|nr:glycine cleavage system protein GcvH [Alphaproteobacteria bacterium]